mgnify:CR=1 FL=1
MQIGEEKQGSAPTTTVCMSARIGERLEDLIDRACDSGFDAVEVLLSDDSDISWTLSEEACQSAVERASRRGIKLASVLIGAGKTDSVGPPSAASRLKRAVEIAHWCGASTVVFPVEPGGKDGKITGHGDQAYAALLETFTTLRFDAMHVGVVIACSFGRAGFITSVSDARSFVDWVNSPFVGVSVSLAPSAGEEEWLTLLGHRVRHVLVNVDAPNCEQAAAALASRGYEGLISLRGELSASTRDLIRRAMHIGVR